MLLVTLPQDYDGSRAHTNRRRGRIVWQQRYDGIASVAYQGGKAIAGISGPWSNHFVLTWWEPMLGGQLEIFDTLEAAKLEVEHRTQSEGCGRRADAACAPRVSWLDRLRALLPQRHRERACSTAPAAIEQLRQQYLRQDTDLSGLHLRACREV
jgi:hypothetical protein